MMKKTARIIWRTIKLVFVVFLVFLGSLFFRAQTVPVPLVELASRHWLPTNLVLRVESVAVGFRNCLQVEGLRLYDSTLKGTTNAMVSVEKMEFDPLSRHLRVVGAKYLRLPDSYYAPTNNEKNARVTAVFPDLGHYTLSLEGGDILGVRPRVVTTEVDVRPNCVAFENVRIEWPDDDEQRLLTGYCRVDLDAQKIIGECRGQARQPHIRPLLVALDLPVSLPYVDGFTEVPGGVPSSCAWKVNLINNDFDLDLELKPTLGKYRKVPLRRADGKLHLHVYTRGHSLNYRHQFGPIHGVGPKGQSLDGTVKVSGTNGYNVVEVDAKSALPLADLLKIGGFTGDYVGEEVFGDSECQLEFRFPRAMTNNYEVLNGGGKFKVSNGYLMRMKGFKGLLAAMPSIAPGVSWATDTTQASGSYRIENGVVKVEDCYLEGTLFSIKMDGEFDAVRNRLDFRAIVQFTKRDSVVGKVLHPLAWPFTKLLLEFKMTGTPENPQWTYVSVIHRILEVAQ